MLFNLQGLEKYFLLQKKFFPKFINPFPNFSRLLGIWGKFLGLFHEVNKWGCYLTYGDNKKCFLLQKKCFRKVIAISQFQPFLGEFGIIFFAIFASKSVGMLINLRGLQKLLSFIEKVFSKSYSHFRTSAIFREFGVIFWRFLQEVYLWGCYLTYGDQKNVFFFRKNVLPNLQPFPDFIHSRGMWGKFLGFLQEVNQ